MAPMKARLFLLASVLAFAACSEAPKPHVAPTPQPPASDLAEPRQIVLAVSGMSCESCATSITAELRKTGAVGECEVQLATNQARLTYDASRLKTDDLLIAVRRAGYEAKVQP